METSSPPINLQNTNPLKSNVSHDWALGATPSSSVSLTLPPPNPHCPVQVCTGVSPFLSTAICKLPYLEGSGAECRHSVITRELGWRFWMWELQQLLQLAYRRGLSCGSSKCGGAKAGVFMPTCTAQSLSRSIVWSRRPQSWELGKSRRKTPPVYCYCSGCLSLVFGASVRFSVQREF